MVAIELGRFTPVDIKVDGETARAVFWIIGSQRPHFSPDG